MPKLKKLSVMSLLSTGLTSIALLPATVVANDSFYEALTGGKVSFSARLRYESVEQDNSLKDADAVTLRTTLGYKTGDFHGFGAFPLDVVDRPGNHLVGHHQRANAQNRAQKERRPEQRQYVDAGRLGRGDFVVARQSPINNAYRQQQSCGNRERQQAGDDERQNLYDLHRAQSALARLVKHTDEYEQHRHHDQQKRERA